MSIVRFSTDSVSERPGILLNGEVIDVTSMGMTQHDCLKKPSAVVSAAREMWDDGEEGIQSHNAESVRFHCPIQPSKIVRLEGCYEHDLSDEIFNRFVQDDGLNEMEWPSQFAAPVTSTVPPGEPVTLPEFADDVRPGVELGFVVGKEAKYLQPSEGLKAVSGLLTVATVTLYDDLPGLFGYKSFDSALPVGRKVVPETNVAIGSLEMEVSVNGEVLDTRNTADWRFEAGEIVASVSDVMSLTPGDIVLTGDPMRTDISLAEGDVLSVSVEDVGGIKRKVVRESTEAGIRI